MEHLQEYSQPPAPPRSPPLELEAFLMYQHDVKNQPTFASSPFPFAFPFKDVSAGSPGVESTVETKLEPGAIPFDFSAAIGGGDHQAGESISIRPPLGIRTNVSNDGSDVASPDSPRAGNRSAVDTFSDDFGMNNGEGSDAGVKPKDESNGPQPLWSELKTKAGKERKRLPLACIACRRKKIRCSGEKPACKHCLRSRIPCVYKVTTRKAAPRTDYMAMLDKRLKRMEERIIKIVPKDEPSSIIRAAVKPALPGTIPARGTAARKRKSDEAFDAELDNWTKATPRGSMDAAAKSASVLIHEAQENKLLTEGADILPEREMQEHLAEVFFEYVYGQTYHLLHKPSFMRKLSAGTVPPVLVLAVCAVSARFSNHPSLESSSTPNFLRGEKWASAARDIVMKRYEWPNITILTCLLTLGLHEFGTCQGGRSWSFGGQAIRMAYALQLHRDLDYDPLERTNPVQLSFIDREIRRRTLWACFMMDRFNSSGTERPTFMKEETIKVPLPIQERFFQSDMPGPTENLFGEVLHPVAPDSGLLSKAEDNMGVAAYMIRVVALWGRIIGYLNLGGRELDEHDMWHPESQYMKLLKQAEEFISKLPELLKYTPENVHTHEKDKVSNQFVFLHIVIQQNILFMNRFAVPRLPGGRPPSEMPKDFVGRAGTKAFEAANRISEILQDSESKLVVAPFTGYCAFLSSTVQMFGVFSSNQLVASTSKRNLAVNVKYLTKMKKYWGMFHFMAESLKELYRVCADASKHGRNCSKEKDSTVFQYGDWFDRYPHGVSHSDFDDHALTIKKEKGDDAVLEQKSDYRTVEEFFSSLSPNQQSDPDRPAAKRKPTVKRSNSNRQVPVNANGINNVAKITNTQHQQTPSNDISQQQQQPQQQPLANHISPVAPSVPPSDIYGNTAMPWYPPNDFFLPASHQQGVLTQLDRQLVLGAYGGGFDPSLQNTHQTSSQQNVPQNGNDIIDNSWGDMGNGLGNGLHGNGMAGFGGFGAEPTSAWFMPFNMQPPEIGMDSLDFLGGSGGLGLGMPMEVNGMAFGMGPDNVRGGERG